MRGIDSGYYGYNDDEDGILEAAEAAAEKKGRKELIGSNKEPLGN